MHQSPARYDQSPRDPDVDGQGRVVEVELGEIRGMKVSLTVRPQDQATDFLAIVRLADELRLRLGGTERRHDRSLPHARPSESDTGALFWSWAQPGRRG